MIPHRSLSRDSSENGVSSRVDACRKRLRMIRVYHKSPIETVELLDNSATDSIEADIETSQSRTGAETSTERLDEVGIT
jgi:hypothetical protein